MKRTATQSAPLLAAVVVALLGAAPCLAADDAWTAAFERLGRVLTLRDYNTRMVMLGTAALGPACGLLGSFMLLRKRALLSDALSHATLPGIGLAFMITASFGVSGKSLPALLVGALVFGLLGVACVQLIRRHSRLKEDAALAVVLSVFFGFGTAILGLVQRMQTGSAAGLQSFIYGKAASMGASDALLISIVAGVIVLLTLLLYKEFKLLCFDSAYAAAQGWPTTRLDTALMTLLTGVTVIGLQAAGLILIVALLVIPAAAARFWTERLPRMLIIAAAVGLASCGLGVAISALGPDLPTGPFIVLTAAGCFGISMVFGGARGVIARVWRRLALERKVARQNLLRAMFELREAGDLETVALPALQRRRAWSPRLLAAVLAAARRDALVAQVGDRFALTDAGLSEARRVVRNHRLWELFLIHYADVAPGQVDRGADYVEHVLDGDTMRRLEALLHETRPDLALPTSPHPLEVVT